VPFRDPPAPARRRPGPLAASRFRSPVRGCSSSSSSVTQPRHQGLERHPRTVPATTAPRRSGQLPFDHTLSEPPGQRQRRCPRNADVTGTALLIGLSMPVLPPSHGYPEGHTAGAKAAGSSPATATVTWYGRWTPRQGAATVVQRDPARPEMADLRAAACVTDTTVSRADSAVGVHASAERPWPRSHSVAGRAALGWL
jgi:hypothetical protein